MKGEKCAIHFDRVSVLQETPCLKTHLLRILILNSQTSKTSQVELPFPANLLFPFINVEYRILDTVPDILVVYRVKKLW